MPQVCQTSSFIVHIHVLRIVKKIIDCQCLVRNDGWNFDCFVVGVGHSSRCNVHRDIVVDCIMPQVCQTSSFIVHTCTCTCILILYSG